MELIKIETFLYQLKKSAKLCTLRAKNVLTCQRALRAYLFTCQRASRAYVFTCQRALPAYVLTCRRASLDVAIFSFTAIVAEVVHTVGKVLEFNYYLSSVT